MNPPSRDGSNQPSVSASGDDRRLRLLRLLMVALTTATPIATVASAVAVVELLILRRAAVVAALVAWSR
jgi:hypothetical protein